MADNTTIEWADHTFNPWIGCTNVSPACDNCYAETMAGRYGWARWGASQPRKRTSEALWRKPLQWERQADDFMKRFGRRQRVFCASLADVFDNEVDAQWRADLFALIEATPNLNWLLLTKRIGNVMKMIPAHWRGELPRNVWLGATIANQEEANRDVSKLLVIPAIVRFVSIEPMLGPINLKRLSPDGINFTLDGLTGRGEHLLGMQGQTGKIHWVIAGGESGAKARPVHPAWLAALRDQCKVSGTAFLFKQYGEWAPLGWEHADSKIHLTLTGKMVTKAECDANRDHPGQGLIEIARLGKKAAGRVLDGETHTNFPAGVL